MLETPAMMRRPVAPGDDDFGFESGFTLSLADASAAAFAGKPKAPEQEISVGPTRAVFDAKAGPQRDGVNGG
ncbi:MAG: hypothetical protein M5U12_19725 [Verrucomicrobia bacterium]|nr:hypothetical protein [Verrucomicrobiota bacterium]